MASPLSRPANTDHRIKEMLGVQNAFPAQSVPLVDNLHMAGLFTPDLTRLAGSILMERCFKQAVFYNVIINENACGDQPSTMEWKNLCDRFQKNRMSHIGVDK
jgi:hypothetical protein